MKKLYVQAILELIKQGEDIKQILRNFKAVLKKRGHERLERSVLNALVRILEVKRPVTTLTVAASEDTSKNHTAITAAFTTLDAESASATTIIDASIVGGFIAEHNGQRIDASYKRKLQSLYQNITS